MTNKQGNSVGIAAMLIVSLLIILLASSCGTVKTAGGCGGSPIHLGN